MSRLGSADMDLLVHRAIKITIKGKSYRMGTFIQTTKNLADPHSHGSVGSLSTVHFLTALDLPSVLQVLMVTF